MYVAIAHMSKSSLSSRARSRASSCSPELNWLGPGFGLGLGLGPGLGLGLGLGSGSGLGLGLRSGLGRGLG